MNKKTQQIEYFKKLRDREREKESRSEQLTGIFFAGVQNIVI